MTKAEDHLSSTLAEARAAQAAGDLQAIVELVDGLVKRGDLEGVSRLLALLRLPDRADVFADLEPAEKEVVFEALPDDDAADILQELDDEDAAELALGLLPEELAPILDRMAPDEAADVLGDLPTDRAESALAAMDDAAEAATRSLMAWTDDSAGGRMSPVYVSLRAEDTVARSLEHLRRSAPASGVTYYVYVVDALGRLVGVVSLRQLIAAAPNARIGGIMDGDVIRISVDEDQEAAARLMARHHLLALPVVDPSDRLIGVISHDDMVDVLEDESTEDMFHLVGLDVDERAADPVRLAIRRRLPWLALNLLLALVSLSVLKRFQPVIGVVPALAVLFPLVTGQGGNVATQTMTLVVRWMALDDVPRGRESRLLRREVRVAAVNGVAIGLLAGVVALVVARDATVALAMAGAMLANFVAGGLVGVFVPAALRGLGLDPAVASVLFVTTATDALGVLFFLGSFTLLTLH